MKITKNTNLQKCQFGKMEIGIKENWEHWTLEKIIF